MTAVTVTTDVVNAILGIDESSPIAKLRNQKPEQVEATQTYYLALFEPEAVSAENFSIAHRALVAIRVAAHTRSASVIAWYEQIALANGATADEVARAKDVATPWDDEGVLGAAIRRADLITVSPGKSERSDIEALEAAGLTPAGILSLSQVIAFVSYQLRFVSILRAVGGQQ